MATGERELHLVVWGATGFTGRLVAEFLMERHGAGGELRWALGGRSREKLEGVREGLGPDAGSLPLVLGDAHDEASMGALAARARAICTTVGPYARHGSELVAACARSGTHYCDLTGEVPWMRRMIDAHAGEAERSGARIVHTCGFDSIPSDLGVLFLQREMRARHDAPCARIAFRVKGFSGGTSGGTAQSMLLMMEESARDPEVRRVLADPYALNPAGERRGPDGPDRAGPAWDADFGSWTAPFVMGVINTRVVRRTHALLGRPWGEGFRYDEATLMGAGPLGFAKAAGLSAGLASVLAAGSLAPLRAVLARALPEPGEGPSEARREAGYFDIRLLGETAAGERLRARVTGDRDPGYGSTAKMLGEAAVCLARDEHPVAGGFWTPASALGEPLLERLQAHAGVRFALEGE